LQGIRQNCTVAVYTEKSELQSIAKLYKLLHVS